MDVFDEFKDLWIMKGKYCFLKMDCWTSKTPNLPYWALKWANKWLKKDFMDKNRDSVPCSVQWSYSYQRHANCDWSI